jgi:hypothetical protein
MRDTNNLEPAIAILGDSHAYGIGVENEETYAGILANTGFPVSLIGCSSFGTAREFLKTTQLLEKGLLDTPKVLVIHYCPNDLDENKSFIKNNFSLNVKSKESFENDFIRHHYQASFTEVYEKLPVFMSVPLFFRGMSNKISGMGKQETLTYFKHPEMSHTSAEKTPHTTGNPFQDVLTFFLQKPIFAQVQQVIVFNAMSPHYHTHNETEQVETMLESALAELQNAFPQLDFQTVFLPEDRLAEMYFQIDDHTNAMGHAWYADQLNSLISHSKK